MAEGVWVKVVRVSEMAASLNGAAARQRKWL